MPIIIFCYFKCNKKWVTFVVILKVLRQKPHGRPTDIYTLGCFLIELIVGVPSKESLQEQVSFNDQWAIVFGKAWRVFLYNSLLWSSRRLSALILLRRKGHLELVFFCFVLFFFFCSPKVVKTIFLKAQVCRCIP